VCLFVTTGSVAWAQGEADLAVAKTVDNVAPGVGDTIVYAVELTNHGPDTATNIEVVDLLPAEVTFVSSTTTQGVYISGSGLWVLSSLAAGSAEVLTIAATVNEGTEGQTITNVAIVLGADQLDPDTSNGLAAVDIVVTGGVAIEDTPWGTIKGGYR
jgi:uncharacterized repeat protein (TIGR01451 family)